MHIVVALCILRRCFTLLPTTALYPVFYWLGRCSTRTLCKWDMPPHLHQLGSTRGRFWLRTSQHASTSSLGVTEIPHHWRSSKEGQAGLSKPTGLDGRALERSQQPLVSLPRHSLARITSGLLSLNRERGISGAAICLTSATGCRVVTSHNLELLELASWGLDIGIRHVGRKMSSNGSRSPG